MWIGIGLFVLVYIIISTDLINKTVVALLGASLFIFAGLIKPENVYGFIDWNVVFLLVSMMVIVNITRKTGVFQYIAIKTAKLAKGEPIAILILMAMITCTISAFLDNVTTVLIIMPVLILIAVELGTSPIPFIITGAIASNIGGTATLIGDPPNIMIGSAANLDFISFVVNLAPLVLILMAVLALIYYLMYRKELVVSNERKAKIMDFDESKSITDKKLLVKCLAVLGLVILGFLFHGLLKIDAALIALAGASVLMLLAGSHEVDDFIRDVEWGTIFFFVGLFILVGGLVDLGIMKVLAAKILALTDGNIMTTSLLLIWVSGFLSAVIDNIPYVATMIPLIQDMGNTLGQAQIEPLWWSLAIGACFGGNGTLVGASANVVSVGLANKSGYKISFWDFTKVGSFITLITLAISTAYVYIRYFVF
jgi:Na+/H+ antiporter NhaD/arsenite permease-like protein